MISTTSYLHQYLLQSEADIEAGGAKPLISTTIHSRSQLKQYDTEVVTRETVLDILTDLGLGPESELTRTVVNGDKKQSILASIFDALSSAGRFSCGCQFQSALTIHNLQKSQEISGPGQDRNIQFQRQ